MNGAADLGGMMGFGAVVPEPEDERFHADWERRALAITLAMGATGRWSGDTNRATREALHPADYLTSSYYAIWIKALERLLVAHGLVGSDELEQGRPLTPGEPVRTLHAAAVAPLLRAGTPYDRPPAAPARFAVGDAVRARTLHPAGHTRLPRYVRGRVGTVEQVHGAHVLPDTNAHGAGEQPEWVYTVCFDGAELWGAAAEDGLTVTVEAFESYLEEALSPPRSSG